MTVNDDSLMVLAMTSVRMMIATMVVAVIVTVLVMLVMRMMVVVAVVVIRVLAVSRTLLALQFVVWGAVVVGWFSLCIWRAESMSSSCAETYLGY